MVRSELKQAPIVQAVAGTTEVVAAVANSAIVVESLVLVIGADGTAKFRSGGSTDLTGAMSFVANGGAVLTPAGKDGHWFSTVVGEALNLVTTGGPANGVLTYRLESF